jgi:predicted  nucleic acid-binding Zn-ribbon protein
VQRAVDAVTGLAIARQRIDTLEAEVKDLRSAKHSHASELAALHAELASVRKTAEHAHDEARASHHPSH